MNPRSGIASLLLPSRNSLFLSSVAVGVSLLLGADLLRQQVLAYSVVLATGQFWSTPLSLGLGIVLGSVVAQYRRSVDALTWTLVAWSLSLTLGSLALFFGVGSGHIAWLLPLHAGAQGALLSCVALVHARTLQFRALQLGLLVKMLQPSQLCLMAALVAGLLVGAARAGLSVSAFLLSLLVSSSVIFATTAGVYLGQRPAHEHRARTQLALVGAALSGLVAVSQAISQEERLSYPGHVLFATGDQNSQRIVLTSASSGLEVFVDQRVHIASLDRSRYVASLANLPRQRSRILVLEAGSGVTAAHILRQEGVQYVVVVSTSDNLARLQEDVPRLRELGERWLADPRVHFEAGEPLFWLGKTDSKFDVIVADFPAPLDAESSKYFTQYTFGLLTEHLQPGGVALVAGVGQPRFPESYQALQDLAGENRLVRASVPSLGEWAFVELRDDRSPGPLGSTLDSPAIAELFQSERYRHETHVSKR